MQTASSCREEQHEGGCSLRPYRERTKANTEEAQKPLYFILFHIEDTFLNTVVAKIGIVKPGSGNGERVHHC